MSEAAMSMEGVIKRFGAVVALDAINLEVPAGRVFGLLGPNGAGKTTAVRILATVLRPDAGRAEVLGRDVVAQPEAVRASLGLAGQYAAVDENLTGRENLRLVGRLTHLPRQRRRRRADEVLERFDLIDAADRAVRTYSGGMRRRLDLAAALVHRPPVVFLDEPTTGLDPRGRKELWAVVAELVAEGTTVLLTTQYLEEADRLADRIAVVDRGRVIAEGTTAELKARMGGSVLGLRLEDEPAARRARDLVAHLGAASPVIEGATVELTLTDGAGVAIEALRVLDHARLVPTGLVLREPSLDDVFLGLTGHRASPEELDAEGTYDLGGVA